MLLVTTLGGSKVFKSSLLFAPANGKRGLGLLYGGRTLAGLGVGGASNLTPIYISELAPPAIRGRLVGLYEMGWQIGGVVGFWISVSYHVIFDVQN
jgi:MFS family permease